MLTVFHSIFAIEKRIEFLTEPM